MKTNFYNHLWLSTFAEGRTVFSFLELSLMHCHIGMIQL